jgi:Flp pilus assembly protein TadG
MLARLLVMIASILSVYSFSASLSHSTKSNLSMSLQNQITKAALSTAMGFALIAPVMPALADGAVSQSTVYRARNSYGRRVLDLEEAVSKGNFAAFEDKKSINAFDLFISGSNALNSKIDKERKAEETKLEAQIYAAVKSKDAGKLRSAYADFVKVADLKSDFKPGEKGQTDSSGYSPTWGTTKQYIYQR